MRRLLATLLVTALAPSALQAEVAMVHPSVMATDLSMDRVRDMLVGRISTWPDGKPVVLVLINDHANNAALLKVTERDTTRLLRGWKRLVYSGTGAMPLVAATPADAARMVAERPGAFALIEAPITGVSCRFLPCYHQADR